MSWISGVRLTVTHTSKISYDKFEGNFYSDVLLPPHVRLFRFVLFRTLFSCFTLGSAGQMYKLITVLLLYARTFPGNIMSPNIMPPAES